MANTSACVFSCSLTIGGIVPLGGLPDARIGGGDFLGYLIEGGLVRHRNFGGKILIFGNQVCVIPL